ncbi:MAG: NTP transferase domain-containing protein [Pyrinomonadaceae bacterium]
MRNESIAAILLAAGRSRRMGAYKPLLPFGARTVIEACLETFERAGIKEIIVVVPANRAVEVRARLSSKQVRFAVNEAAESEMSASIACGVSQLSSETSALFIALADQPAIPHTVVCELMQERKRTNAPIIAPEHKGRGGHPVLLDYSFRAELLNLDAARGLRGLLEKHKESVRRIAVETPFVARDMDTWEDYCALHVEIYGTLPPPLRES